MNDIDDETADREESSDEESDNQDDFQYWTPQPLKFKGWLGCACHQLQLVVHDRYQELMHNCKVQAAFSKAKSICSLSLKSSHFLICSDS